MPGIFCRNARKWPKNDKKCHPGQTVRIQSGNLRKMLYLNYLRNLKKNSDPLGGGGAHTPFWLARLYPGNGFLRWHPLSLTKPMKTKATVHSMIRRTFEILHLNIFEYVLNIPRYVVYVCKWYRSKDNDLNFP